jgi:hypothetical protein
MNFYKIVSIASAVLFVFLFVQLFFIPVTFVTDLGLQASETSTVLARRTAMFMLGMAVLMFGARNIPNSKERQIICLATGSTLLGLACMGIYEFMRGTVNNSIFIAIGIETLLWVSFLIITIKNKNT